MDTGLTGRVGHKSGWIIIGFRQKNISTYFQALKFVVLMFFCLFVKLPLLPLEDSVF